MAYRAKKDLISDNFYQCNQFLGKQVTEVCDAKSAIYSYMIADSNTEFPDGTVYSTYSDINDMFQNMYSANVDNEISIGKKKLRFYYDDVSCATELETVIEDITNYAKELDYKFGDLLNVSGKISADFVDSVAMVFLKRKLTREEYERYQSLLVQVQSGDPVTGLTQAEKEEFISLYETLYPADANNMESMADLFADDGYSGYEIDVLNIKLLAYTAEEPYKSVYIDNIDLVKEGNLHHTGWSTTTDGKFFINVADMSNPRTAKTYNTFFHETSHCIDYFLRDGKVFTAEYRDSVTGLSLNDVLEMDVELRINTAIDDYFINNPNITLEERDVIRAYVMDSIMNQVDYRVYGKPDFEMIVGSDPLTSEVEVSNCYEYVVLDINNQVVGFACDIYGGLTGNTIKGTGVYHESIVRDGGVYRVYWISGWIDSDGTGLYITLDNGERFDETIDFTDSKQWSSSDLDERVIMSNGEVEYKNSIAGEFFANVMGANLSRDVNNLSAYGFYYSDTINYFENMLNSIN